MDKVILDVPRVITFVKANNSKLNNSLHVQYHRKQYELVTEVDKAKLKIPDGLPLTWNKGIAYETKIDQQSALSADTAKLKKKDQERSDQLKNIFLTIRAQKHSHLENMRDAALRLAAKLRPYENIQRLPYEMESSRLLSMEDDTKSMTADIATLNLTDAFAHLKTLNEEFEQLHVRRRTGHADEQLPLATEIRPQTDAAFEAICQYIQSAYLFAASDEDRALIDRLVDRMNKTSEAFKIMQRNLTASHKKDRKKKKAEKKKRSRKSKGDNAADVTPYEVAMTELPEADSGEYSTRSESVAPDDHQPEE